VEWLPIVALIVSALVAASQLSKEWRERRALSRKEKRENSEDKNNSTLVPIRGANEAVVALQAALISAARVEDRLRSLIETLEKETDEKDKRIQQLEERVWRCERSLNTIEKEGGTDGR
jgi:hypothetical protein